MTFDQTHWISRQQKRPLPTFYYHEHFQEMLDFVMRHYSHVLLPAHVSFVDGFRKLSRNAQCLYVRLVNRKGCLFARTRVRYEELGDSRPLLRELQRAGWVEPPEKRDFRDVLGFLTRAQIYDVVLARIAGVSRSMKKAELITFVHEHIQPGDFMAALDTSGILVQRRADAVRYLLFLYFGRIRDSLTQFTMRDLGLVRTQALQENYEPRFADREEALEHYFFASRLKAADSVPVGELAELEAEMRDWPEPNFSGSAGLRDSLATKLGGIAERAGQVETAMAFYRAGESAECSERLVRLLLAAGERDAARKHLQRCLDDPRNDEEWLFARDLYELKFNKKRTTSLTDALRAAEKIDIDESKSGNPERAVAEHFESVGMQAYRTENVLWRTLFGLLFWEELFAGDDAKLHSPFELTPATLMQGSFYDDNSERIETKLAALEKPGAIKLKILKTYTEYYGTPNGIFRWRQPHDDALFALLEHADHDALSAVLRRMCQDYANSRYGYPDLLVIDTDGVRFVEVKTAGDQLRRNQLLRLEQLRNDGFRADVAMVRWVLDPQQAYVVVDVETTGGRGDEHRVTEIGAVKVRDGEVIDRFQTLLNPQRSIPPNITRLTGISPAMVEQAPLFADIAEKLAAFMQGAIFVAHNVEFDYGFIAAEFRRIGQPFRYPRLCTCASMRRLYPGHRSYSLASLCRAYDIPLPRHHRALCDAEAAAELLLLINEKRQAMTG